MREVLTTLLASQTPAAALNAQTAVKLPPGKKAFMVKLSATSTVKIEASVDNSTFSTVATFTATGTVEIDSAIPYWRSNNSAWTSGTVEALVSYSPDQDA